MISSDLGDDVSESHFPSLRAALAFVVMEGVLCAVSACTGCRLASAKKKEIVERKATATSQEADQDVIYTLGRGYHMTSHHHPTTCDTNQDNLAENRLYFSDLREIAVEVGTENNNERSRSPACDAPHDVTHESQANERAQDAANVKSVTFSDNNEVVFLSPKRTCSSAMTSQDTTQKENTIERVTSDQDDVTTVLNFKHKKRKQVATNEL